MLVPILVVVGLAILIPIIIEVSAAVGMNASLGKRGDGSVSIKYPLPSEQKDLVYKKDYFFNDSGNKFVIFEYRHKSVKEPKKALLMIHGLGCGHFYLLPLINYFAKQGYLILAYDQFASGLSEGKAIKSMTVGARDVKFALKYVDEKYGNLPLSVFGHSWGGFTASIALNYSNRIEKTILVSGFNRQSDFVLNGNFLGILLSFVLKIRDAFIYKKYVKFSTINSLKKIKNYNIKNMIIAGGVSANKYLRGEIKKVTDKYNVELSVPKFLYCTDNGAMIGAAAYPLYLKREFMDLSLNAEAVVPLKS